MPAKLIPDSEVAQLCRQGKTDKEIAEYLLEHLNVALTPNAITRWRRRQGMDTRRHRYTDLIPWRVKVEHAWLYIPKLLRWESRLRAGLPVSDRDRQRLDEFKAKLDAAFDGRGGVVHYDPETQEGWWVVERRPGIDTDMIRNPDVP